MHLAHPIGEILASIDAIRIAAKCRSQPATGWLCTSKHPDKLRKREPHISKPTLAAMPGVWMRVICALMIVASLSAPTFAQQSDAQRSVDALVDKITALASEQESDRQQLGTAIEAKIKALEHKAVASLYISAAEEPNLEKMLDMTSPVTRRNYGDDKLRKILTDVQIPIFFEAKLDITSCNNTPINDPDGTTGTEFVCDLKTKTYGDLTATIFVLEEQSNYVASVLFAPKVAKPELP